MTESGPLLQIESIEKRFDATPVLRGVSLEVKQGTKLALIGPSGSGKSTLLRVLMGLERPDAGEVVIAGERMWVEARGGRQRPASERHLRHVRRHFGMVFQHFHLFPHKTALGNVMEGPLRVLRLERSAAEARARALLDRVGLGDRGDAWPRELSGGQKQRVAIARALAMEPSVLLLDEVTSALDPELVGEVTEVLLDLARDAQSTILIVTHQMDFARRAADRVVFMADGLVVEDGPPSQVLDEPTEARTRRFLGHDAAD